MGFIIMEPEDTPPMSGSNSICVATVLLDAGILPMQEPVTAECHNGKAERISIENVPSYADRLGAPLEVKGVCALKVDIACGGDSFVIVDAAADGLAIRPEEAHDLARWTSALSLPPTSSLASRIPRLPAGTASPSVSSPGRSRAREMNFTAQTLWLFVPARSTIPRRRATSIAPARSSAPSLSAASRDGPRLGAGHPSSPPFLEGPGSPA
jgi:hypothetical protein